MATVNDLADLIAQYRATLERAFAGEIARLRAMHGNRAVDAALVIAEQARRAESVEARGESE